MASLSSYPAGSEPGRVRDDGKNPIYKPLAKSGEIRILTYHSREPCDAIECPDYQPPCKYFFRMENVALSSESCYEALSYEWGAEDKPMWIWMVDQPDPIPVRQNLYYALVSLIETGEQNIECPGHRRLWIDALCIDQSDDEEKELQIMQMGKVYSMAEQVVVWLGRSDASSSLAMSYISKATSDRKPNKRVAKRTQGAFGFDPSCTPSKGDFANLTALWNFYDRKYWTRLWIIQELTLAKKITLLCGLDVVGWDQFAFMDRVLDQVMKIAYFDNFARSWPEEFKQIFRHIYACSPSRLRKVREERSYHDRRGSLRLIEEHMYAECQNPVDKIYGLRSLFPTCCQDAIPVNYRMPVSEVCNRVLKHHMDQNHSGTEESFLKRSQRLHQMLYLTPANFHDDPYPPSSPEDQCVWETQRVVIRGRIIYISPSLRGSVSGSTTGLISVIPPTVTSRLKHFMNQQVDSGRSKAMVNSEVDLVYPIISGQFRSWDTYQPCSDSTDYHFKPKPESRSKSAPFKSSMVMRLRSIWWSAFSSAGALWNYLPKTGKEDTLDMDWHTAAIESLISCAKRAMQDPPPSTQDCRVAFEENGAIFLVPIDTKIGDIICELESEEQLCALAVLDKSVAPLLLHTPPPPHDLGGCVVSERSIKGRAVNFFAEPSPDD